MVAPWLGPVNPSLDAIVDRLRHLAIVYSRSSCERIGGHGFSQEMMTHDGVSRGGESLKSAASILGRVARQELTMMKIALFICLLITVVSGCSSVINNSESFYRDIPRRPINWREYLTD